MILCPPPETSTRFTEFRQRFADEVSIYNAIQHRKITYETPCVRVLPAGSRPPPVSETLESPHDDQRLFLFTEKEHSTSTDPREGDYDVWHGPIAASDVGKCDRAEKWYRISDPIRVVDVFPDVILNAACAAGDEECFDAALAAGANPNDRGGYYCAMHEAVRHNRSQMVSRLLESGWKGDGWSKQFQSIKAAVKNDSLEIIEQILPFCQFSPIELNSLQGACKNPEIHRLLEEPKPMFSLKNAARVEPEPTDKRLTSPEGASAQENVDPDNRSQRVMEAASPQTFNGKTGAEPRSDNTIETDREPAILAALGLGVILIGFLLQFSGFGLISWAVLGFGVILLILAIWMYLQTPSPMSQHKTATSRAIEHGHVVRYKAAVQPAKLQHGTIGAKDYPMQAYTQKEEGLSLVRITIQKNGHPVETRILKSSGSEALDNAACSSILERFRYHPARDEDGNPVPSIQDHPVSWHLSDLPDARE